jgi:hypothetical protein
VLVHAGIALDLIAEHDSERIFFSVRPESVNA